jgi:hypothetical protein
MGGRVQQRLATGVWVGATDGDLDAFRLMSRHYSFNAYRDGRRENKSNPNRRLFVGPGGKIVLVTPDLRALFVWRKFIDASGQEGVNCAVFRNESRALSSSLILEAEKFAWNRWPADRLYTYVSPKKIKSRNPGYCFICAGWRRCGTTKGGLVILEKLWTEV